MTNKKIIHPAVGATLILLIPLVMIMYGRVSGTRGWNWGLMDFITAFVLLFGAGFVYEVVAGKVSNTPYKVAVGLAAAFVVFMIWVEMAVGGVSQFVHFLFTTTS